MDDQFIDHTVLKNVISNIPFGLVVSKEGRHREICFVNKAAYEMVGYTREEYIQLVENGWNNILDVDLMDIIKEHYDTTRAEQPFEVLTCATTKKGKKKWLLNQVVVKQQQEIICYVSFMDITNRIELERIHEKEQETLRERAARDSFTKLLNRGTMEELIGRVLREQSAENVCACIVLDVDNFKQINDIYGHCMGDVLILELSDLLREHFSEEDLIGRMGGDEFAVFSPGINSREDVVHKAKEVLKDLRGKKDRIGLLSEPSVSIGIAFSPDAGSCFQELYSNADDALYSVKKENKNGIAVFQ